MKHLNALKDIINQYDIIFCDVWGVVHNGVEAFPKAVNALKEARDAGKTVVFITNAPRPHGAVTTQLLSLGVSDNAYDRVVTSGDVTRDLISKAPKKIFHIGPDKDLVLYDGLDVELVEEFEAQAVVVTGLFDDLTETPEDYAEMLQRMRARNLPMICANPDIVIHHGSQTLWCAGALARDYTNLGGRILISGKPHSPIYELALHQAEELKKHKIEKSKILAIGDGLFTDVKGAEQFGLDVLFISGGIHVHEYKKNNQIDNQVLESFMKKHGFHPVAEMEALQ